MTADYTPPEAAGMERCGRERACEAQVEVERLTGDVEFQRTLAVIARGERDEAREALAAVAALAEKHGSGHPEYPTISVLELRAALTTDAPHMLADLQAEIERLTRWKAEAAEVLTSWEGVWQALGGPGPLGRPKSEGVLAEVERLTKDRDDAWRGQLAVIAERDEACEALAAVAALALRWTGDHAPTSRHGAAQRFRYEIANHADTLANIRADVLTSAAGELEQLPGPMTRMQAVRFLRDAANRTAEGTDR